MTLRTQLSQASAFSYMCLFSTWYGVPLQHCNLHVLILEIKSLLFSKYPFIQVVKNLIFKSKDVPRNSSMWNINSGICLKKVKRNYYINQQRNVHKHMHTFRGHTPSRGQDSSCAATSTCSSLLQYSHKQSQAQALHQTQNDKGLTTPSESLHQTKTCHPLITPQNRHRFSNAQMEQEYNIKHSTQYQQHRIWSHLHEALIDRNLSIFENFKQLR